MWHEVVAGVFEVVKFCKNCKTEILVDIGVGALVDFEAMVGVWVEVGFEVLVETLEAVVVGWDVVVTLDVVVACRTKIVMIKMILLFPQLWIWRPNYQNTNFKFFEKCFLI